MFLKLVEGGWFGGWGKRENAATKEGNAQKAMYLLPKHNQALQ